MAERDAYEHELKNARRFNLDKRELANIQATMDFYYPLNENGGLTAAKSFLVVKSHLAETLLNKI